MAEQKRKAEMLISFAWNQLQFFKARSFWKLKLTLGFDHAKQAHANIEICLYAPCEFKGFGVLFFFQFT